MKLKYLNPSFILLLLIMELILNQTISSQELKHKRRNIGTNMIEEYSVLKSNKDIREGPYKLIIDKFICQIGSYKNNLRSGTWQIFYSKDTLELEYNYDTNELIYFNKKYYLSKDDSTLCKPIYLGGYMYFFHAVINSIDPKQLQCGNGLLIVSFDVDSSGIPSKFLLRLSSGCNDLDIESVRSIRIVATSNFKYMPAKKDGKPFTYNMYYPLYVSQFTH